MPVVSKNFIILEKVDSTNNYAMGIVRKGMGNNGDAVFAMEQTAGKGRRERTWKSLKGENIILTLIAEMQWLPVFSQFQLSLAVSLGCYDFVAKYVEESIKIKWPNDIFINDRKAGGILIENVINGSLWQWSIIGIGLNVNQEDFEMHQLQAISFRQATGKTYDVPKLARELHKAVFQRISQLEGGDYGEMLEQYNSQLFAANKKVRLKRGSIVFETTIQGVSPSGELITKDAMERSFTFDEIEWLL
ncbi:MAG: biotin--[acetyl-CoA-carboxylase] ligase [Ginsengibacter sp.]